MKASELIKKLTKLIEKNGDLEVIFREDGCGGHAYHTIDDVSKSLKKIRLTDFEDFEHSGFRKLFPKVKITDEMIENWELPDESVKCIELEMGTLIYSK